MTTKQAVVESLLGEAEDKRAWTDWYRRNACAKHGVEYAEPKPPNLNLITHPPDKKKPQDVDPISRVPSATSPTQWGKWLAGALAFAGMALGIPAGSAISGWMNREPQQQEVQSDVGLYQDIQEQGHHLAGPDY